MNGKTIWGVVCMVCSGVLFAQQPAEGVGEGQTRLVVYRPVGAGLAGASEVQVQGRHHTVLTDGEFSDMCVLAGEVRLSVLTLPSSSARIDMRLTLAGGRSQYVRVSEQGKRPLIAVVDEAQAREELKELRQQSHTRSRAGIPCSADPMPSMQSVLRETLAADVAWSSDGSRLTESGRLALDHLVTRAQQEFVRVERVRVVAHVDDPAQSPAAQRRAELVQQVLQARAGRDWPVTIGVRPLAVSTLAACAGVSPAQMDQACPLGPRLVALEVVGVRR
ncbi:MAG: hypothetical protein FJY36_06980 [Betaproteobacteria bacterium]|nr:hypothetical protein [Betaproteobacteria bacterium]